MNFHVLFAVFRRNFVNYFANPTGYLFICGFVSLGSFFAFCTRDFFGNNLANLDQLSLWFPLLMLIYIPTITMGIWADERKQGTDELLLTIPAADFDIVLGKYLAALGIFTVALLFSLVCNYYVLNNLACPDAYTAVVPHWIRGGNSPDVGLDTGLFFGTYFGYWLVGLAMLGIGLAASFLTGNITIGFVLGVVFNAPLVFLPLADAILGAFSREQVQSATRWSIGQQMHDFTRGMLTLGGIAYFLVILVVMLYASMVLIGRRHWFSGPRRWLQVGHFLVRGAALVAIALGLVVLLRQHDLRCDVTSEQLSSLSPETRKLIADLKTERPVLVEAFISPTGPNFPEEYVQTRLNLLTTLEELRAIGGNKLTVKIHDTDRFSKEAALAEKRYGIQPHQVMSINHGAMAVEQIFLNVAVSRGSSRPVPPAFIDRDTPIEYELVRSIGTVTEQKRKKVGVLNTDAQLYGQLNFQTMSPSPNWPIIDELEKQYEVVKVDPTKPISEKYDVLLAVQPSTLGPEEMNNFVAAVAAEQPTAIFEDPAPMLSNVPATSAPRQAPGGMNPMMRMQAPPKGDIRKLWNLLGIDFSDAKIVWQDFNPYPKIPDFSKNKEFVFADVALRPKSLPPANVKPGTKEYDEWAAGQPFNPADPISSGLQQVLFPFPGFIDKQPTSELKFTPLVETGEKTGTLRYADLMQMSPFGPRGINPDRPLNPTGNVYYLAAHIQGKVKLPPSLDEPFKHLGEKKGEKKPVEGTIDVVVTTDVDMLSQAFFVLREQGERPEIGVHFRFDNVTFVLNILDSLAKDDRFIEIRKRRPAHRMLARIEEETKDAKQAAAESRERFSKKYEEQEQAEQKAIEDKIAELKSQKNMDLQQMAIQVGMMQQDLEKQRESKLEQLRAEKDREFNKIETKLKDKIDAVQSRYLMWAILLPPILPLFVAIGVFIMRRVKESEGVAKSRLR